MPNNKNERKGKQAGELSAEERFRNFFSTSVIDLPEEMTHRDAPAPVEEKPKAGLLGKLFGHDKDETPASAQPVLEIPTGEILLGADAKPVQPEQEDMALELRTADPVPVMPMQPARPEPVKAAPAEPVPAPKAAAAVKPQPKKPALQPELQPVAAPQKQPKAKNAPETLLPQEELEQREMQQLKDMLNGMSGKAKPAPQPAKPVQAAPQPAPAQPAAEPEKAPAKAAQKPAEELPSAVFASVPADPETLPKKPEKKSIFQMFGTAEDEKPAARKPEKEDTMSLPLLPLEQDGAPADETVPAPAADAAVTPAQPEDAPAAETAAPAEDTVPESTTDKLHHMAAELTLRCVLAGILAVVLLHLGLTAERLLPPLSVLDPDAAPAAFYAANLLLFAASLFVGYPVLRDGLTGLRGRPSADTMPALAAVAALLQAVVAMLNANAYRSTEGIGLLTGMAALGLFLALVGSRVMLAAVQGGYTLAAEGGEVRGAYRTRDKDLIRALARDLEQKDPWVLLSRPVQTASDDFVEQSLSERASERRARKVACVLLAAAVLSGVAFLLFGGGINCAVAAAAAVLCMGAPLSSVLVPGLAALRLQRAAAAVGAVVPGWAAIEELGGIDTIELDADDLFTADSVTLEESRAFFEAHGYAVHTFECQRMMLLTHTSPELLVHKCPVQIFAGAPLTGAAAQLVTESCGEKDFGLRLIDKQLGAGARVSFAYNRAEIPVSFCVGEGYGSAFYLSDVYTAENFRGQGYAAAAVLAMLGFARNPDMGYTDVFLYADDPAAIRLYEKLGFRGTPVREYRAFKGGLPDLYTEAKE